MLHLSSTSYTKRNQNKISYIPCVLDSTLCKADISSNHRRQRDRALSKCVQKSHSKEHYRNEEQGIILAALLTHFQERSDWALSGIASASPRFGSFVSKGWGTLTGPSWTHISVLKRRSLSFKAWSHLQKASGVAPEGRQLALPDWSPDLCRQTDP